MELRHLLIVGSSIPNRLESFYVRAFEELGVQVTLHDPDAALEPFHRGRVINRVTLPFQHIVAGRSLRKFYDQPRWDAVLVVKGYMLSPDALRACRARLPVPWAVLNPDSPFETGSGVSSRHIRRAIPEFDLYFTWSHGLIPRLREAGNARPVYLPFAYDETAHCPPLTLDPSLASVITMVGSYDRQRATMLEALADLPLSIYGTAWDRLPRSSRLRGKIAPGELRGENLRRVISSSLASVNILRPQNAGAHNMRTFEVPAMGGVMLTTRSAEQQQFFPEGEACLMFSTPEELRTQALRLLAGDVDVAALRRQALERSTGHSYLGRARIIKRELESVLREI